MLETFKSRLKTKYSGVNLSQKRIDAIADRLHKKFPEITEEADHDAKIEDYYDEATVKEIAKEDDKIRTLEANQKKPAQQQQQQNNNQQQQQQNNEGQQGAGEKTEMEKLTELVTGLATTVKTLTAEKSAQSRAATLKSKFEEKKIPEKFWSRMQQPEKEEEFDRFVEDVDGLYKEIVPETQDATFIPGRSSGKTTTKVNEKEVNGLVDSLMNIQPAETQKN